MSKNDKSNEALEINVDLKELLKTETELSGLAGSVANRSLDIGLVNSRGGAAENLTEAAEQLKSVALSLESLISKTGTAVKNMRESFNRADMEAAEITGNGESL